MRHTRRAIVAAFQEVRPPEFEHRASVAAVDRVQQSSHRFDLRSWLRRVLVHRGARPEVGVEPEQHLDRGAAVQFSPVERLLRYRERGDVEARRLELVGGVGVVTACILDWPPRPGPPRRKRLLQKGTSNLDEGTITRTQIRITMAACPYGGHDAPATGRLSREAMGNRHCRTPSSGRT